MNKKRGKLNIVDIVVIAVIITVLAYAVYALAVRMENSGGTSEIRYVIEASEMRDGLSDNLAEGDALYNGNGEYLGKITAVSVAPAFFQGADKDGNAVYSNMDDFETVYVTVSCEAEIRKTGFHINGENISVGNSFSVRTPSLWFEGTCVSVEKVES